MPLYSQCPQNSCEGACPCCRGCRTYPPVDPPRRQQKSQGLLISQKNSRGGHVQGGKRHRVWYLPSGPEEFSG